MANFSGADVAQIINAIERASIASQSPFWHHIVGPIAIVIVGLSGAFWAWSTIRTNKDAAKRAILANRDIAKQKATIDYLMSRTRDDRFVDSYQLISTIDRLSTIDIKCFTAADVDIDLSPIQPFFERELTVRYCMNSLSYILNQFEYMAVAVEKNIYDEDILIECSRTSTVSMFDITEPYIKQGRSIQSQRRQKASTMYIKYEQLVARWRSKTA